MIVYALKKFAFFLTILLMSQNLFAQLHFSQGAAIGTHFTRVDSFSIPNPIDSLPSFVFPGKTTPYVGLTLSAKRKIGELKPAIADIMVSGKLAIALSTDGLNSLFWQVPVTFDLDFENGFYAGIGFVVGAYDINEGFKTKQIGPVANMGFNYLIDQLAITSRVYYLGNFGVSNETKTVNVLDLEFDDIAAPTPKDVFGVEIGVLINLFKR